MWGSTEALRAVRHYWGRAAAPSRLPRAAQEEEVEVGAAPVFLGPRAALLGVGVKDCAKPGSTSSTCLQECL